MKAHNRSYWIGKNILIAASLANLCMLPTWSYLVFNTSNLFYYKYFPANAYLACFINLFLLTFVFFNGYLLSYRFPKIKPLAMVVFLIMMFFALNGIRVAIGINLTPLVSAITSLTITKAVTGATLLVLFLIIIRHHKFISAVSKQAVLLLSPAIFITTGNAYLNILRFANDFDEPKAFNTRKKHDQFRVMLIIFDGLDYRITFDQRPKILALPSIDDLKQTSIFFSHSYPPGQHTKTSIPSMCTGEIVLDSKPFGLSDLSLKLPNQKTILLSESNHLFKQLSKRHISVGLTGWYLPYGRLFGEWLSKYTWHPMPEPIMQDEIITALITQLHLQFLPFRAFDAQNLLDLQIPVNNELIQQACAYAQDNTLGMVYAHFMKPHFPHIYDITKNKISSSAINSKEGYLGDLVLVDLTLFKIKESLMQSNMWDKTLLIVTSDHPWMQSENYDGAFDSRVPVLIKMPNQSIPITCNSTWNTTLIYNFILDFFDNNIKTPDDCIAWIRNHANQIQRMP